ncbi:glycosyltransferase family 2 protein [Actinocrispum wychmicini]|uniref:4,4'-diaponeurosporenoate glycosyltransferase n=1 Tax=Actinocrispum wychmicini TaxID=1213861 RepID=A0A4R2JKH7_9PSEU|nr:glycosyltransferase [Actinocrispum wychmicini]TCO60533.1 glycosyl transferase family 2 [Actinocrispum wychmicini]
MELWVVIPAYNEENSIAATLGALESQRDKDFSVVVVDNASTDRTAAIAKDFGVEVIREDHKGTGAAADTGIRYAIDHGATHLARTDADCLPDPDWIGAIRRGFADGLRLIGGRLRPRTDEFRLRWWERTLLPSVVESAAVFGRFRPGNRDPGYLGPYMMCPGCNLAITAELYLASGGFPRTAIEEVHEDRALVNRVRRVTNAYGRRDDVLVLGSVRRLRAYGLVRTLAWYADHRARPDVVDVR